MSPVTNHTFDLPMIERFYRELPGRVAAVRARLNRPLTLTEKILYAHLDDLESQDLSRGKAYAYFRPDRLAMQDATAQMAILQFMSAGIPRTLIPSTVHCDHLIRAQEGATQDLARALGENQEVYDFLESSCAKYGIGFWKPGAGIIHQVVLENYAFPGAMCIGTDSHTPNAGGLCMIAIGVGGADAVDVMVGFPWGVRLPKLIGIKLTGTLNGWTSPKDIILKVAGILTVKGGTGAIVEYFGPGTRAFSTTGKGTITNMGAEIGATTSVFPWDERATAYLQATGRPEVAALAAANAQHLTADPQVEANPAAYYDQVIEIDLSTLEPQIVGPHTPDLCRPISGMKKAVKDSDYPEHIRNALIGSCTNSSYEDMSRAADVARQATEAGLSLAVPLLVTPGSERIHKTIQRDGQMATLQKAGAVVLANACGPCIGQWKRTDIKAGEKNAILTSYNRNFPARNDGSAETMAFIGSPEVVTALAFSGKLTFNPLRDGIFKADGTEFRFRAPKSKELPADGFVSDLEGYLAPAAQADSVAVRIDPKSDRLAALEPFETWNGKDPKGMPVLLKAKGKCTTDHISMAGPWLRYRGHLDKISDNMFLGANNAFSKDAGTAVHQPSGKIDKVAAVARTYKKKRRRWVVFGDENYGEGSSREHAAMEPRHLGCAAVIVRSFARIHETNLKKQGVLALTLADPKDWDKVKADDKVDLKGLTKLAPDSRVTVILNHADGTKDTIETTHTMTAEQIEWFKAGSALNYARRLVAEQAAHDGEAAPAATYAPAVTAKAADPAEVL